MGTPAIPEGALARPGDMRDRRGRGTRGPLVLSGPLTPEGVPAHRTRREQFDALVLAVVEALRGRWEHELGEVEFAVEEAPLLPPDWRVSSVPAAITVPATRGAPRRIVVFRLLVQQRARTAGQVRRLVHDALVEQVAGLLGRTPEEIDPD